MTFTIYELAAMQPALLVMIAGLLAVGLDTFVPSKTRIAHAMLCGGGVIAAMAALGSQLYYQRTAIHAFGNMLVLDDMACFLSLAILAATGLVLISSDADTTRRNIGFGEYYGLIMIAASAMMMLVASNDFMTIFVNLEVLSLALYVLTGITRKNPRSNEASVKYLVSGAFATCFFLMGVAFLYGATGTFALSGIREALALGLDSSMARVGLGMVMVGFAFKIGAVPFHMWVPDVYEGAPTSTTAFMSVTVKAAGVGALIRVLLIAAPMRSDLWADLLWWMAVATMVVGNLMALQQTSVKRMLAFSSVAHTGYALVALATMRSTDETFVPEAAASALFYLLTYTFMTLGAFSFLIYMGHELPGKDGTSEWQDAETLSDLAGMADRRPWAAAMMGLFLLSLGGIPPTAGFLGKFYLFAGAIERGHVTIAVIGVMASLVSLYYYLRVIVWMYMKEPMIADEKPHPSVAVVIALAGLATLLIGVMPGAFIAAAEHSIAVLR